MAKDNAATRELAELLAQRTELDARIAAVRERLDAELVLTIANVVGEGIVFSAHELVAHAQRVSDELRTALTEAGIVSTRQLGKRLRRLSGRNHQGWHLDRFGLDEAGVVWRLLKVSRALSV